MPPSVLITKSASQAFPTRRIWRTSHPHWRASRCYCSYCRRDTEPCNRKLVPWPPNSELARSPTDNITRRSWIVWTGSSVQTLKPCHRSKLCSELSRLVVRYCYARLASNLGTWHCLRRTAFRLEELGPGILEVASTGTSASSPSKLNLLNDGQYRVNMYASTWVCTKLEAFDDRESYEGTARLLTVTSKSSIPEDVAIWAFSPRSEDVVSYAQDYPMHW